MKKIFLTLSVLASFGFGQFSTLSDEQFPENMNFVYPLNNLQNIKKLPLDNKVVAGNVPLKVSWNNGVLVYGVSIKRMDDTPLKVVRTFSPPCVDIGNNVDLFSGQTTKILPPNKIETIMTHTAGLTKIGFSNYDNVSDNRLGEVGCRDIYNKMNVVVEVFKLVKGKWILFRRGNFILVKE